MKFSIKQEYIEFFRKNDFNAFPINPSNGKKADSRYDADRTELNQEIKDSENYGYIPRVGKGNCIVDLDSKRYKNKALELAKEFTVVKTGRGFQIPVIGLTDDSTKIELYDYNIQDEKIIEIQGTKHYGMGIGSKIFHEKLQQEIEYTNVGTDKIFNAKSDYNKFVDQICKLFGVTGKKKTRNQHYQMRERFKDEKLPSPGTSNDYFFNAAIQCNTDGMSKQDAIEKIKKVYDEWKKSPTFSGRMWSNIETKIDDVYDNNKKIEEGRHTGSDSGIDRTVIAQEIIESRLLYSDIDTEIIYENKSGFLEPINGILRKELQQQFPIMEKADFREIESKILGLSEDIPERSKDLIVFQNGIYSISKGEIIEIDDLAFTGFKEYDYIEKPNPKKFLEIIFENVPKLEHERLKAGLQSILKPYLDPKMTVIHGLSGVGKSTGLSIIVKLLGQYAMVSELNQLLNDRATKANLKGKLFLVIQELPNTWKNLNQMKIMLGEQRFSGRANYGDHQEWDNTIKAFSSANYLPAIPEDDQTAMHSRRLSLIHNTRQQPYPEDPTLEEKIIESEGSEILSYLVNLMQEDFKYENKETNQSEWEKIANPEDVIINKNYTYQVDANDIPIFHLIKSFKDEFKIKITKARLEEAFQKGGFNVYASHVKNCVRFVPKDLGNQDQL
jgi:hypothetical protein